jgi:hypothetical protein
MSQFNHRTLTIQKQKIFRAPVVLGAAPHGKRQLALNTAKTNIAIGVKRQCQI